MFIKLTRSGPRRYLQLAESYRDENGRVKQRTLASLGRLEQIAPHLETIVRGLHRVTGQELPPAVSVHPDTSFNRGRLARTVLLTLQRGRDRCTNAPPDTPPPSDTPWWPSSASPA